MATRYDVSAVPPQGGYVAKQCPVRAQWDAIRPNDPAPPDLVLAARLADGRQFEAGVVATLCELHPDRVILRGDARADREAATSAAMASGARLIIGGRLPADATGHRVGEPDLLVAAAGTGYRAVDIKHHRSLADRAGAETAGDTASESAADLARCAGLDTLALESAAREQAATARRRRDDLLQLAHYQRMLEAAGMAGADGRYGGIIGVEQVVVWYDLDAPMWRRPSSGGRLRFRSTMEVYDFEFDFRLDIIAVAMASVTDQAVVPLVVPVRIGECPHCPWLTHCRPLLEAGSGDVSLLPRVGWREWRIHRDHGVTDRAGLAALDHRTASLLAAGVDLRPVLAAQAGEPPSTPLADVLGPRKQAQLVTLAEAGLTTLGDAAMLCARTASYSDAPMQDLPEQIDQARAALGSAPVYRRRGVGHVSVPRGDIEVDIDMENTTDGVYLWGALVTVRQEWTARPGGYLAFRTWEPMTATAEVSVFIEFWEWLTGMRAAASADGLLLRAYCYNAAAENSQLRRLAAACGRDDEVADFTRSADWIDLHRVFGRQLITGGSTALKSVAPLAGFGWEVADPGGDEAMLRYERAAGRHGDQAAREWLLAYNRNDTEATRALRHWLDGAASQCPPVADATMRLTPS